MDLNQKLIEAGINVPADTSDEVKELLLQKHEAANTLESQLEEAKTENEKIQKEATEEIEKARLAAKDANAKANAHKGFGTFNHEGEDYVITMAKTQVFNKDSEWEIITAEELKESTAIQARVIKNGWGIAVLKSKFKAAQKKGA